MPISRNVTRNLIKSFKFKELFFEQLGWDELKVQPLPISITDSQFSLQPIAQKKDVQIYLCDYDEKGLIPLYPIRKKIDTKLRKHAFEHLIIFIDAKKTKQIWMWVSKEAGKPTAYRQVEYNINQSGEELLQKLNQITFSLDEEEGLSLFSVTKRLKDALDKDKVTKKFYEKFQKEHDKFLKTITGISKEDDKKWYASLLLNRLMFIYFIQKKGFLDNDLDYMKNRMERMKNKFGNDKFYSFYRYFLLKLFHEGLGSPQRNPELEKLLGKIPYLNGGLFDVHKLEKEYEDIQITDEAFEKIFSFFDAYHWHLDNRPIVKGNEVNPDVIGYIFEKYINQKQMGAYYTKEDITDYISKNTIIPFLFDEAKKNCKIAFIGENNIWKILKENPDRYFYDAVKKGCDLNLPEEIEIGVDSNKPNLFERRKNWNKLADEEHALPTEIWREVVARRQRYFEVTEKIENGEVNSINDFITYNLNIRQFIQDVIDNAEGHELIKAFYKAATEVSVLDPTCGSGAFLFAALNILEEIYEALIERIESFVFDLQNTQEKFRSDKFSDFKKIITEINKHISRKYFIYKSIIINNLYGVDIMDEAIEIAKLRLFLKLASVCEKDENKPNMGIEPLPDIDFHLKAGNTLIGFTNKNEIERVIQDDIINKMYIRDLPEKLDIIDKDYKLFNEMQKLADYNEEEYHKAKVNLETKLSEIRNRLNEFIFEDYGYPKGYEKFLESHKPFHWFIEFYHIMHNGGFDVIIGNPPYVGYTRKNKKTKISVSQIYKIKDYYTTDANNLYAFTIEKSFSITKQNGYIGMIIPISAFSNANMLTLQNLIKEFSLNYISNFHQRPAALFEGVLQRLSIFITKNIKEKPKELYTTKVYRWLSENRNLLFRRMNYLKIDQTNQNNILKVENKIEESIISKIKNHRAINNYLYSLKNRNSIFYRTAGGGYWITFLNSEFETESLSNKIAYFDEKYNSKVFSAILNSNLFWWVYSINYDQFNFKDYMIFGFKFNYPNKTETELKMVKLSNKLENELIHNSESYTINSKTRGSNLTLTYNKHLSKATMNEIDKVLAKHYGFTDEELDFIINYDIKYRMGKDWIK